MGDNVWRPSKKKYGVAICNYSEANQQTLTLHVGETVHIFEEYGTGPSAWYRGTSFKNKEKKGIFPACLIHIKPCTVDNEGLYETITPVEDAMVKEVAYVLREWSVIWKDLFVKNNPLFDSVTHAMRDLLELRGQLVDKKMTQEDARDVKDNIINLIDWGNGQLGMDLVPRIDGEQVDADICSITQLHRVHVNSARQAGQDKPGQRRKTKNSKGEVQSESGISSHHLLASFKHFGCQVQDASETLLSLYQYKDGRCFCITEKFAVKHSRMMVPEDQERINNCYGLFTDLTSEDLDRDLFLVAHIYRVGKMLSDNSKKAPTCSFKRPWGVAVARLSLGQLPGNFKDWEFQMKVSYCGDLNKEKEFTSLHETMIRQLQQGQSPGSSSSKLGHSLTISIRILHGELAMIRKEDPMLFSKKVSMVQKLGHSDVITPGEVRNDLYMTLVSGEFDRGSKTAGKNVEVKVSVYDAQGKLIQNCITYGGGEAPQSYYNTAVFYHSNRPEWNETIRISVPIDVFPGSHVCFELFHCSVKTKEVKKPFGLAYFHVTNKDRIVIADGTHDLCLYKVDGMHPLAMKQYLTLPFLKNDLMDTHKFTSLPQNLILKYNEMEVLTVATVLCSGKFTQNSDLLGILSWRSDQFKNQLSENLAKLRKMQAEEIVKFLAEGDLLDALFDMLSEDTIIRTHSGEIFSSMIYIFTLVHHARFETFKPLLEAYITDTFAAPLVHKHLCDCFARMMSDEGDGTRKINLTLYQAFSVIDYIFKFIVQSRQLQMKNVYARGSGDARDFQDNIEKLFASMAVLLSSKSDKLNASQVALLENLHLCYMPLLQVISQTELARLICSSLENMPSPEFVPEDITKAKLKLLRKSVQTKLFMNDESRRYLLDLVLEQIKYCLKLRKQIPLCVDLLGDVMDCIFKLRQNDNVKEDIQKILSSIFDVVMETVLDLNDRSAAKTSQDDILISNALKPVSSFLDVFSGRKSSMFPTSPAKRRRSRSRSPRPSESEYVNVELSLDSKEDFSTGALIACLTEMLRLMDDEHYQELLYIYHRGEPLKSFLINILTVFKLLVQPSVFPKDWTIMRMVTNNVVFTAIEYFTQALKENYMSDHKFSPELWNSYFNLAVSFIIQPSLQLDRYSEAKAQKLKERYGDMRVLMGMQVGTLWHALGKHKQHFIPGMIGQFLHITLVPEREVRKATLPIICDIMETEQKLKGHFKVVEATLIERLDYFLTQQHIGDEEYKNLFNEKLLEQVKSEPALQENGTQFIISVTHLLERLLDYRQVVDGEENKDKRMHCTFNILNFYKDEIKREEMYIRYVNKLHDLHMVAGNHVEAGLTLQLYARILTWSERPLPEEMRYKHQRECDRREMLYTQIINCFDKGKVWEYALPMCKDLAEYYERNLDYKKLGDILKQQASFYQKILEGEPSSDDPLSPDTSYIPRQDPSYYMVSYYGNSFPAYVRNKQFIYRGDECLKLETIMNHLTAEFPAAQIKSQRDIIKDDDQQYIQICSVKTIPTERPEFKSKEVPVEIKNFYNVNEVDTFQFPRPYHRGKKNPDNESKSLCVERTKLRTAYKFPGILRWYEVVSIETEHLCPIRVAIDQVKDANLDTQMLITRCQANPKLYFGQLSMKLNGMIQAAVNGGISKFHDAFFSREFEQEYPEEQMYLEELQALLLDQVNILARGMVLHGKLAPQNLLPLHMSLDEELKKMRKSVMDHASPRGSIISVPSIPEHGRPGTPSSISITSTGSGSSYSQGDDYEDHLYSVCSLDKPRRSFLGEGSSLPPPVPDRPRSMYNSEQTLQSPPGQMRPVGSDPTLGQRIPGINISATVGSNFPPKQPATKVNRHTSVSVERPPQLPTKRRPSAPNIMQPSPNFSQSEPDGPPAIPTKQGSKRTTVFEDTPVGRAQLRPTTLDTGATSSPVGAKGPPALPPRKPSHFIHSPQQRHFSESDATSPDNQPRPGITQRRATFITNGSAAGKPQVTSPTGVPPSPSTPTGVPPIPRRTDTKKVVPPLPSAKPSVPSRDDTTKL